jgi:ribosome-binding factor A
MARKRVARLNEQLKRELTTLLQFAVKDPRVSGLTITDVEVTPDLYHAKVYFTTTADEEERTQALQGLRAAAGFLRSELGRRLHIRRTPELHFEFDSTLQHAFRIEQLLQEARAGMSTDPDAPVDDDSTAPVDELDGEHDDV